MIHSFYDYYLTNKNNPHKNWMKRRIYWNLYKVLKQIFPIYYNNLSLKNINPDSPNRVVVSLTTIPKRIDYVHLAIKSVLNQSLRPSIICLALGKEFFPNRDKDLPKRILELKGHGLNIIYTEDLKPHTKYIEAFKSYKNDIIITIDDDIIYPKDMIERLLYHHFKFPNTIIANRVREIGFVNNKLDKYRNWKINKYKGNFPSKLLLATGVGGVLYPPGISKYVNMDSNAIKSHAISVDDIWLKANQLKHKIPVVFTNYYFQPFIEIKNSQKVSLHSTNVFENQNDKAIKGIFEYLNIDINNFNED